MISDIFVFENLFLIAIAVIWIIVAAIQDIRKLEVANWWNFSLIIVALAYRGFLSVSKLNYWYILWGVIGLGVGFAVANLFYYGRLFAGGDAKLMMALGAVLPLGLDWQTNFNILTWYLLLFLLTGGIYGSIYSIVLALKKRKHFVKEFGKGFKKYRAVSYALMGLSLFTLVVSLIFGIYVGFWLSFIVLISPGLLLYARAVEEVCMVRLVKVKDLVIGDWIVKKIIIGRRKIEPNWQGISEEELKVLQKKYKSKVMVKYGIPFTPTFLFALVGMLIIFKYFNWASLLW